MRKSMLYFALGVTAIQIIVFLVAIVSGESSFSSLALATLVLCPILFFHFITGLFKELIPFDFGLFFTLANTFVVGGPLLLLTSSPLLLSFSVCALLLTFIFSSFNIRSAALGHSFEEVFAHFLFIFPWGILGFLTFWVTGYQMIAWFILGIWVLLEIGSFDSIVKSQKKNDLISKGGVVT